jgi:hypothetical protein
VYNSLSVILSEVNLSSSEQAGYAEATLVLSALHSSNLDHSTLRAEANPEDGGSMSSARTPQYKFSPLLIHFITAIKRVILRK